MKDTNSASKHKMEHQISGTAKIVWWLSHFYRVKILNIVFAPKYMRKIFYRERKAEIGKILGELCSWKQAMS